MIKNIQLLRNIGTFDSDSAAAALDFGRVTLIYAENGRGKTTLAAILRSLASGDPLPILERHRLGAQHPPHICLNCEGQPSNVMFQNGAWNRTLPDLKIFDDVFVNENVYSGLDVEPRHRQNLHELILGDQGVALNRRLQGHVSRIQEHNSLLDQKAALIPEQVRGGLSVDDFCDLSEIPNIESRIEETEQSLRAARDLDIVRTTNQFDPLEIPDFDTEGIKEMLLASLSDLDQSAATQVLRHLETLGEGGESWVARGVSGAFNSGDGVCPFCGQSVDGLELVAHYRAYFSQYYDQLKSEVADMLENIKTTHADGIQANFERSVRVAIQRQQFWANYCDVPQIELDTESIVTDWNASKVAVAGLLTSKQAAPLEEMEVGDEVISLLNTFGAHRSRIQTLSENLALANDKISEVKEEVESADLGEIRAALARLKATKARFSIEYASLCGDYLQEKSAKTLTEAARDQARSALVNYRNNVFPTLQGGVNTYLQNFNAGFRINSLEPLNIGRGGGSSCAYNVVINNEHIAVRSANSPEGEPSFRNSLSAGDRNTLALALFFSSLDEHPNLANATIVIDDPMSSLDEHRSLATIQAVRRLCSVAGQVIILSHSKRFLCSIWDELNVQDCLSLEIGPNGGESTIRSWDVSRYAKTEHDLRHVQLQEYDTHQSGNIRDVARAIRPHLEGFLRVACAGDYHPGNLLGPFVEKCRRRIGCPDEILDAGTTQELRDILDYANKFQHDTNPAWQTEQINSTELLGFVRRTLTFVGPPRV